MKIQRASLSDINSIVKITRTKENRKALPWVMKVTLQDAIEHPQKNILLVAKDKMDEVVGFIRLYCRMDKTATLHEIAVLDESKGQGIGKKLLSESEKLVKEQDCNKINLKMPKGLEKTHVFYSKNSFIKSGEVETQKRSLYFFTKPL